VSWCCKSFWVVPCVSFCTDHFVIVPLNITYLHCLQHLFNLYLRHISISDFSAHKYTQFYIMYTPKSKSPNPPLWPSWRLGLNFRMSIISTMICVLLKKVIIDNRWWVSDGLWHNYRLWPALIVGLRTCLNDKVCNF